RHLREGAFRRPIRYGPTAGRALSDGGGLGCRAERQSAGGAAMSPRRTARAMMLVELLIAVAVLAMISMLIYSSFSGMRTSRDGIQRLNDRYREGRIALSRIARELSSAYLSGHEPIDPSLKVIQTAFISTQGTPADRIDFNTFAHRRLDRDAHESDQAE